MRGRALAVIDAIRVRHVRLVIGRVEVHTIPAAGEENLCPKAIRAIRVSESWRLRGRRAAEVNAKICICFRMRYWHSCVRRKEEADHSQEMAFDSGVPVLLRANGSPVSIRSPSGKGSNISPGALRWR